MRHYRTQEVAGSSPATSINETPGVSSESSGSRRRRGRVANHETRREFDVQGLETLPFEESHQQTHTGAAHLCKWLANSGEGRRHDRRVFDVVESDDGKLLRNS
jgi:hypothetical protein